MTLQEFRVRLESMILDRNYWLNSKAAKSQEQKVCWEYSRELLETLCKMLQKVEKPDDGEIHDGKPGKAAQGYTGLCRAKKKDAPGDGWNVGEVVTLYGRAYMMMDAGIRDDGSLKAEWAEVDPDTVQRCTGKEDSNSLVIFEGDVLGTMAGRTVRMEVCYGRYSAFCPNDREFMENIGFFVVSNTTGDAMPLGPTEDYSMIVGNVVDNPELRVI